MRDPQWVTRRSADEPFDDLPPRRNKSLISVEVWFAMSDRTVVRGEVMFESGEDARSESRVHSWYLSSDDTGRPYRGLSPLPGAPWVCAWALIDVPQHPFMRRRVL